MGDRSESREPRNGNHVLRQGRGKKKKGRAKTVFILALVSAPSRRKGTADINSPNSTGRQCCATVSHKALSLISNEIPEANIHFDRHHHKVIGPHYRPGADGNIVTLVDDGNGRVRRGDSSLPSGPLTSSLYPRPRVRFAWDSLLYFIAKITKARSHNIFAEVSRLEHGFGNQEEKNTGGIPMLARQSPIVSG